MAKFDKRKQRMFIIKIIIQEDSWHYKKEQEMFIPLMSNSNLNAMNTFENRHCGSEYPRYFIDEVIDCFEYGFFEPNYDNKSLI